MRVLKAIRSKYEHTRKFVCVCLVSQLSLTLCDLMDCVAQAPLSMGFSRQEYWSGCLFLLWGSSQPRDRTLVSCIAGRFFTV